MRYLTILLGILVLLAACQQTTTQQETTDDTVNDVQDVTDEIAEETGEVVEQQEESTEDETQNTVDFSEFFNSQTTLEYMVEYDVVTDDATVQMTQYMNGIDMMRIDTTAQGTESRTFMLDGTMYSCMQQSGDWTCFEINGDQESGTAFTEESIEESKSLETESLPSRTIAGVPTTCFRVFGQDNDTVDYCFSPENVPLYIKTMSDGETVAELTATSYSTSVSDSDFELPAEPSAIPGYP